MAASNYFGFTHATGPQYSTQPPPAYSHPSTATYSIQQAPTVPHAVTASYSPATVQAAQPVVSAPYAGYQSHQPPQDYTYRPADPPAAPHPTTTPQTYQVYSDTPDNYNYARPAVVTTYDNKQYYQTSIVSAQRSTTDNYYQTVGVKSAYTPAPTTVYSHLPPPQRQVTTLKPLAPSSLVSATYNIYPVSSSAQQPQTSVSSYTLGSTFSSTASVPSFSGLSYPNYDSAGYSCTPATSYYQSAQQTLSQPQQQQHQQQLPPSHQPQKPQAPKQLTSASWSDPGSYMVTSSVASTYKKPPFHPNKLQKPRGPIKQPQLHYCDICKISCAGPQTYREHLEGQKHKKKEAALKTGSQMGACNGPKGVQTHLRCELCDVSCTGVDAYAAHIRGSKHQKVVKLHTKLGKPIPSTEPVLVNSAPVVTTSTATKNLASTTDVASFGTTSTVTAAPKPAVNTAAKTVATVKKLAPSKTSFTSSKPASTPAAVTAAPPVAVAVRVEKTMPQVPEEDCNQVVGQGDIQPVGHDYVEKVRNADGKVIRFHCKLCECSFNDPNAKDMHLKGRRHRLQYKRKVNPELPVEIKPSNRARKLQESKLKKHRTMLKRQQDDEELWHVERRRYEDDMYWRRMEDEQLYWEEQRRRMAPPPLMSRRGMPVPPLLSCVRRPDSPDDRLVMAKHATIYPGEEELQAVQRIVSHSERALKMVSDNLFEKNIAPAATESEDPKSTANAVRLLRGVMRVGILAKGLLLRGDTNVHLILLTSKKPTISLLKNIAKQLPKELATFSEDQYTVQAHPEKASVVILSSKEPIMQVTISLTSPLMRDDPAAETDKQAGGKAAEKDVAENDPPDLLNKKACLEHLAALRHAKWFQARANGLQSCVIIIRVLRDLSQRVPIWGKVPSWALELLVEKVISSATGPLSPGEALRRVLECMATGILLPDGAGLLDPCEKQPTDALESMKLQDREDVTASAQHALRLLAFRQIHRVLAMDSMSVTKAGACNRKRRRDINEASEGEGEGEVKKEKKVVFNRNSKPYDLLMAKMSWTTGTQCVAKGDHRKPKPGELLYHKGDILTIVAMTTSKRCYKAKHNSTGDEGIINSADVREREALRLDPSLSLMPWFHGKISGPEAVRKLQPAQDGLFLVRESIRHPGDYVLCVSVSGEVIHYRVMYQDNQLTIDNNQHFNNLIDMIEFYSQNKGALARTLLKPKPKQGAKSAEMELTKAGWLLDITVLKLGHIIGEGEFGAVFDGEYLAQRVAVKTIKCDVTAQAFLQEATVMTKLQHKNLVRLLGVILHKGLLIVTELMTKGNLANFLRTRGRSLVGSVQLLRFALDVCEGMAYLESKKLVHRDLAARNVLLSDDDVAKVSDFGLTRAASRVSDDQRAKLPVRWSAPEALTKEKYSTKSDVWSYGILLWEIFSYGRQPYPKMSLKEVMERVEGGFRMEAPEDCLPAIYALMTICWAKEPRRRPTFHKMREKLEQEMKKRCPGYESQHQDGVGRGSGYGGGYPTHIV